MGLADTSSQHDQLWAEQIRDIDHDIGCDGELDLTISSMDRAHGLQSSGDTCSLQVINGLDLEDIAVPMKDESEKLTSPASSFVAHETTGGRASRSASWVRGDDGVFQRPRNEG